MVVNMISTTAMIGLGKVYQNLMVDVQPTNEKLREPAKNIISQATSISDEQAFSYLEASGYNLKLAIVMIETSFIYEEAQKRLQQANGFVRKALQDHEYMGIMNMTTKKLTLSMEHYLGSEQNNDSYTKCITTLT